MKRNEPVSKIMTANPITVNLSMKPSEVRALFESKAIRHLPVVSGDEVYGMISATDMVRFAGATKGQDPRAVDAVLDHTWTLESMLTRQVATVSSRDTIRSAAELFAEGRFNALPVVDGQKLVGIVTTTDVIRYLLEQY